MFYKLLLKILLAVCLVTTTSIDMSFHLIVICISCLKKKNYFFFFFTHASTIEARRSVLKTNYGKTFTLIYHFENCLFWKQNSIIIIILRITFFQICVVATQIVCVCFA